MIFPWFSPVSPWYQYRMNDMTNTTILWLVVSLLRKIWISWEYDISTWMECSKLPNCILSIYMQKMVNWRGNKSREYECPYSTPTDTIDYQNHKKKSREYGFPFLDFWRWCSKSPKRDIWAVWPKPLLVDDYRWLYTTQYLLEIKTQIRNRYIPH